MGLRYVKCLIFIMGFLLSGSLAKEPKDSRNSITASATSAVPIIKTAAADNREENSSLPIRVLLPRPELKSLDAMPQMDVVTPTATVPIFNPSNPTGTTTPTYNPIPTTNPTSPLMTPFTPTMTPPNPYTAPGTGTPLSSSGQSWCIASQTASQTALQVALDYACGYGGADCSSIQPGESCYNPDTIRDHASYAFNSYYQKNPIPTSCDFGGTAVITNVEPSTSTCQYPSTSTNSPVPNTTNPPGSTIYGSNPPGSTIYGSVPPDSIDNATILRTVPLLLTLMCLLISMGQ